MTLRSLVGRLSGFTNLKYLKIGSAPQDITLDGIAIRPVPLPSLRYFGWHGGPFLHQTILLQYIKLPPSATMLVTTNYESDEEPAACRAVLHSLRSQILHSSRTCLRIRKESGDKIQTRTLSPRLPRYGRHRRRQRSESLQVEEWGSDIPSASAKESAAHI